VGLPDNAVKESRERIKSALRNCGFGFSYRQAVTINLAPQPCGRKGRASSCGVFCCLVCEKDKGARSLTRNTSTSSRSSMTANSPIPTSRPKIDKQSPTLPLGLCAESGWNTRRAVLEIRAGPWPGNARPRSVSTIQKGHLRGHRGAKQEKEALTHDRIFTSPLYGRSLCEHIRWSDCEAVLRLHLDPI
jgi:hypothetical protein